MPATVRLLGKTPEVGGGAVSQALAVPAAGMPGHRGGMAGGAEHQSHQTKFVSATLAH